MKARKIACVIDIIAGLLWFQPSGAASRLFALRAERGFCLTSMLIQSKSNLEPAAILTTLSKYYDQQALLSFANALKKAEVCDRPNRIPTTNYKPN